MHEDQIKKYNSLFRMDLPERSFNPTIQDVIQQLEIEEGKDFAYARPNVDRYNVTLSPEIICELDTLAGRFDLARSVTMEILLSVAMGEYEEWWNRHQSKQAASPQIDIEEQIASEEKPAKKGGKSK